MSRDPYRDLKKDLQLAKTVKDVEVVILKAMRAYQRTKKDREILAAFDYVRKLAYEDYKKDKAGYGAELDLMSRVMLLYINTPTDDEFRRFMVTCANARLRLRSA